MSPGNDAESHDTVTLWITESAPILSLLGAVRSRFAIPESAPAQACISLSHTARRANSVPMEELELLEWKRRIFALYAAARASGDAAATWRSWRDERDALFREHPQSPLPADRRNDFQGLPYFDYDPAFRVLGEVGEGDGELRDVTASSGETVRFRRFGIVQFQLAEAELELSLYWLEGYGGGVFLPFADSTSGNETYGGGRYLLDTVKGSDLGGADDRLVLDFNFAYNPSCAYDPRWVCPLSPPENRLPIAVRAGELH